MKKSFLLLIVVAAALVGGYLYLYKGTPVAPSTQGTPPEETIVPEDPTLLYEDLDRGFSIVLTKPWMQYAVESTELEDGSVLASFLAPTKLQPAGYASLFTITIFPKAQWEKETAPCAADPSVSQICGQISKKLGENEDSVFVYSLLNGFPEEDQKDALEDVEKKIVKSFKVLPKTTLPLEEEAQGGIEGEEGSVVE